MKEKKYPKLIAAMAVKGDTQWTLCDLLGVTRTTIYTRLIGKTEWTIGEIEKLCERYNKDYYELFK